MVGLSQFLGLFFIIVTFYSFIWDSNQLSIEGLKTGISKLFL